MPIEGERLTRGYTAPGGTKNLAMLQMFTNNLCAFSYVYIQYGWAPTQPGRSRTIASSRPQKSGCTPKELCKCVLVLGRTGQTSGLFWTWKLSFHSQATHQSPDAGKFKGLVGVQNEIGDEGRAMTGGGSRSGTYGLRSKDDGKLW